uniref:Ski oncogene n=1 Tax=Aceria tosichella TaxID=561515 RepID=A0A6G1SDW8_9ACAR
MSKRALEEATAISDLEKSCLNDEGTFGDNARIKKRLLLDKEHELCGKQHQPIAASPSKHLVKTLSDLPKFVTIENFRVASYEINGEPHLCLPHLLQYIQQEYPLDKVIETFEKIVNNFHSATSKQVEGFIKAIVLPPGATDCPLIRRSDAERVCLVLYDQCSNDHDDDEDDPKSSTAALKHALPGREKAYLHPIQLGSSGEAPKERWVHQAYGEHSIQDCNIRNKISKDEKEEASAHKRTESSNEKNSSDQSIQTDKQSLGTNEEFSSSLDSNNRTSDETSSGSDSSEIFGNLDQNTFLNLARAATSTLMIKVYHRCFGKCNGLYYPMKLKHSESKCIECSECHRLFSPRRFIGHTHKHTEKNVFHWGFNSYNWRYYIYLCRNQDMNVLDEDELLVQLARLKAMPDRNPCESECGNSSLGSKAENIESNTRAIVTSHDRANHIKPTQRIPSKESNNLIAGAALDNRLDLSQSNQPINIVKPTMFETSTSSVGSQPTTSKSDHRAYKQKSDYQRSTFTWPMSQLSTTPLMAGGGGGTGFKMTSEQNTHITNACSSNTLQFPFGDLLSNPLLFSHIHKSIPEYAQFNSRDFNSTQLGLFEAGTKKARPDRISYETSSPQTTSAITNISSNNRFPMTDKLIKQDMFVSSSMAAYLSSRCLDGDLIRDIIEQTLDAIRRSRMLF